jgi:hypothetical protein
MFDDDFETGEEMPNHMIVWLDQHIGQPEHCQRLKAAFSSTADPNYTAPINLIDRDEEAIDNTLGFEQITLEGIKFLLAAFTQVERCVEFLEQHQNKRIFFITSGSMGRSALPVIMYKCKNIFTDPVTNEPYPSIYVYCHNIENQLDWLIDYTAYIQVFTFDEDLLVRMIRDIADYFLVEGKRLIEADPPNYPAAYNRLSWTHTLYNRYMKMEGITLKKQFAELNELIERTEEYMKPSSDDEN